MHSFLPYVLLACIASSGVFINFYRKFPEKKILLNKDSKSLILFRIAYPIAIITSFACSLSSYGKINVYTIFWQLIGIFFFVFGMFLRWRAILYLNKEFTVTVTILKNHCLKTNNVYTYIRHPSYTGLILYYLGLGFSLLSMVSIFILFATVVLVILIRVSLEEKVLLQHFGLEYSDYSKRTKKLIPFIY